MDYKFKTPSFFSILTADVRYCKELTASEKIFYSEISALANIKGYCTANNDYFCELYKVNKRTIQRWLENLKRMVDEQSVIPMQFDAAKCGFGHFYYSMTPKTSEIKAVWVTVEGLHKKFHDYGRNVKDAIQKGDISTAEKYYRDAESVSKDLLGKFRQMKEIAMKKNR